MQSWPLGLLLAFVALLHLRRVILNHEDSDGNWTYIADDPEIDIERAARSYRNNCTMASCVDVRRCLAEFDRLTVFVQPLTTIIDTDGSLLSPSPSREFLLLRQFLLSSEYSVEREAEACFVFPGVDFLNLDRFPKIDHAVDKVYLSLLLQRTAANLLIFCFYGHDFPRDSAILLSGQPISWHFRHDFDLSLPLWTGKGIEMVEERKIDELAERSVPIVAVVANSSNVVKEEVSAVMRVIRGAVVLTECDHDKRRHCDQLGHERALGNILKHSVFVLVYDRCHGFERLLLSSLSAGTIPILVTPSFILPIKEVIDWHRFSLSLASLDTVLLATGRYLDGQNEGDKAAVREEHAQLLRLMSGTATEIYSKYMADIAKIAHTSLMVLEGRVLPHRMKTYEDWNLITRRRDHLPWLASEETPFALVVFDERKREDNQNRDVIANITNDVRFAQLVVVRLSESSSWSSPEERRRKWRELRRVPGGMRHLLLRLLQAVDEEQLIMTSSAATTIDISTLEQLIARWRESPTELTALENERGQLDFLAVHKASIEAATHLCVYNENEVSWAQITHVLTHATDGQLVLAHSKVSPSLRELRELPAPLNARVV